METAGTLLVIWSMHAVVGAALAAPILYFGRKRVGWANWELHLGVCADATRSETEPLCSGLMSGPALSASAGARLPIAAGILDSKQNYLQTMLMTLKARP